MKGKEDVQREIANVPTPERFSSMISPKEKYIQAIFDKCQGDGLANLWFSTDAFILVTGVVANITLLWLFLRDKNSLSASKVLGVNLVVMDLIYLSVVPFDLIYITESNQHVNRNHSDFSATAWQYPSTTHTLGMALEVFSMFNLIGCPLLLTCMCIERYLAVVRPVLYLRARKWEYRMAVSAVVWVFTLSFCVTKGLLHDFTWVLVSIIISCLFLIMLACLGGVVWSLLQQSPAHTTYGNQARSDSPLRRQAVGNVLVVVVPAVIAYLPVLAIIPMVLCIFFSKLSLNKVMCYVFELSLSFPKLGVLIGPLFYLSKARQMCCLAKRRKTFNE